MTTAPDALEFQDSRVPLSKLVRRLHAAQPERYSQAAFALCDAVEKARDRGYVLRPEIREIENFENLIWLSHPDQRGVYEDIDVAAIAWLFADDLRERLARHPGGLDYLRDLSTLEMLGRMERDLRAVASLPPE